MAGGKDDDLSFPGDETWAAKDRQAATEWFEYYVTDAKIRHWRRQERLGRPVPKRDIKLNFGLNEFPFDVAELLLASAKDGMHKAQGRKWIRPPLWERREIDNAVHRAERYMAELHILKGDPCKKAKPEAAEREANRLKKDWDIKLKPSTLMKQMRSMKQNPIQGSFSQPASGIDSPARVNLGKCVLPKPRSISSGQPSRASRWSNGTCPLGRPNRQIHAPKSSAPIPRSS
jgi:hypothetical protein